MARRVSRAVVLVVALLGFGGRALASPVVIDFEAFTDSESLTNQIPGLTFQNAMVLSAGISLNEFEFPPYSGSNVAFDAGGPMRIDFGSPLFGFGGYFTYSSSILLEAFDAFDSSLGSVASLFGNNLALSGDLGSFPVPMPTPAPGATMCLMPFPAGAVTSPPPYSRWRSGSTLPLSIAATLASPPAQ